MLQHKVEMRLRHMLDHAIEAVATKWGCDIIPWLLER